MSSLSYVLITPARNEAAFIRLTLKSVTEQTVPPLRWIVVSDGSTDGTDELVHNYAEEYSWIKLVRMPERTQRHFAAKISAFNAGVAELADLSYDLIGSLDADTSFDPDYFEFLLNKMAEDPKLGLAGTPFKDISTGSYDFRFASTDHVSGACQLFRRECYEQIGGYQPVKGGGVDLIAVVTARMRGWKTKTFTEKTYLHHRTMGSAQTGALMGWFKNGAKDYALGCHPLWEVFRTAYQMSKKPYFLGGVLLFSGYLLSAIRRVKRPISDELMAFRRREQLARLHNFLFRSRTVESGGIRQSSKNNLDALKD